MYSCTACVDTLRSWTTFLRVLCDPERPPSTLQLKAEAAAGQAGFILCMAASCRREDPATWLRHQKRHWREARSKRKRRKVDEEKGAGNKRAPPGHPQHQQQLNLQPKGLEVICDLRSF